MVWVLRDVDTSTDYVCFGDPALVENINNLDYAHGQIKASLPANTHMQLVDKLSGSETVLLDGWLTECVGPTVGGQNSFQLMEYAHELAKTRVGTVANVFTVSYAATASVDTVLGDILPSGWQVDPASLGQGYTIPPTQFSVTTIFDAVKKIFADLIQNASYEHVKVYFWFDSANKYLCFGQYRTQWTAEQISFTTGKDIRRIDTRSSHLREYDAVMVIGQTKSIYSVYPDGSTSKKMAVFNETNASTAAECYVIAKAKYLSTYGESLFRPQMSMKPYKGYTSTGARIHAGDQIYVDGQQLTLVDVVWKQERLTVGFNQVLPVDSTDDQGMLAGEVSGVADLAWDPGTQNVASDNTTETDYTLTLTDVTNLVNSEFNLKVTIGPYKAYSAQEEATLEAQYLSTVTIASVYGATTDTTFLAAGNTLYLPNQPGQPAYLISDIVTNGFQYGEAYMSVVVMNDYVNSQAKFYAGIQYSYDGAVWFDSTCQTEIYIGPAVGSISFTIPVPAYAIIPGTATTSRLYVRGKVSYVVNTGSIPNLTISKSNIQMDVIPRHTHTLQQTGVGTTNTIKSPQTDDLHEVEVTPPASLTCTVNGHTMSVGDGSTTNIGAYLITGTNHISFKGGTVCTVTPHASYRMYGS